MSLSSDSALEQMPGHLVRRAQQLHSGLWAEVGPPGLTSPQYAVLAELGRSSGVSQVELGERTGIDRSTLAEMAGRMEEHGLVDRVPDPADGRRKLLSISEAGSRVLREATGPVRRVNHELTSNLTPSERHQLLVLLAKVLR